MNALITPNIPLSVAASKWARVRLGEVVELAYGKSLPKGTREEGSIPVYGSNGIAGRHNTALIHEPTVIVGRKGSAGAIQLVTEPCYPIDTTYYTRVKPGYQLNVRFLAYALRILDLGRLKTSTGVPGLNREDAYRDFIPLPSLADQLQVVDILSRAEAIVRMRGEAEHKTKGIIPALFMDMFGDAATNPKGWGVKSLAGLMRFVSGGTPSKSRSDYWKGTLPWVSPKDMKVPQIFDSEDHVSDQVPVQTSIKLIPSGSVLIVVRGMILVHTVPIAITRVPVTINQDMKAFLVDEAISADYLMWLLRISQQWLLTLVTIAAHGTRKIDTARLEALAIPVPPRKLQDLFVQRVNELLNVTASQSCAKSKAETVFQSLLAGVFVTTSKSDDDIPIGRQAGNAIIVPPDFDTPL